MHEFCFYLSWAGWKPEVWAAWVQAVGSVAAIIAAYWIARWQHSQELKAQRRQAALEAKSLAMVHLRDAKDLLDRIGRELSEVEKRDVTQDGWVFTGVTIPQTLWDGTKDLHRIGAGGGEFLRALYYIQQSRDHFAPGSHVVWKENVPAYTDCIESARQHVTQALARMKELLR